MTSNLFRRNTSFCNNHYFNIWTCVRCKPCYSSFALSRLMGDIYDINILLSLYDWKCDMYERLEHFWFSMIDIKQRLLIYHHLNRVMKRFVIHVCFFRYLQNPIAVSCKQILAEHSITWYNFNIFSKLTRINVS